MKFTVHRDSFQQAINAVQRATATRVIQPILSNILIETTPSDELKLSATDLDFAIETKIPVSIMESGRTTLSSKKLSEIVSKLPSGTDIRLEIDPETSMARLYCDSSVFDIRTLPADEFPVIKQLDPAKSMEVQLKALVKSINQTCFAAASQDMNNVLGGVFFQLQGDTLEMAATDGSRLARRMEVLSSAPMAENVSAIIPARALQEFLKLAGTSPSEEETVSLTIQDGQIAFRTARYYVMSRLLDGQYPKYQQLIPQTNTHVVYANRHSLIASLERVAVMANERTNVVKMAFDSGSMSLVANTPDVGDSRDSLPVDYAGEPLNIAFNYKYVLDALKVIDSDDVRVEMNGSLSPTLFKAKEENGYLCLVMPVQVK